LRFDDDGDEDNYDDDNNNNNNNNPHYTLPNAFFFSDIPIETPYAFLASTFATCPAHHAFHLVTLIIFTKSK